MYTRELYARTAPDDVWVTMSLDRTGPSPWPVDNCLRTLSCRFRVIARLDPGGWISYACAEFEGSFVCYYDASIPSLVVIPGTVTQTAATALRSEDHWDMQVTCTGKDLEIQCIQTSAEVDHAVSWEGYIDIVDVNVTYSPV